MLVLQSSTFAGRSELAFRRLLLALALPIFALASEFQNLAFEPSERLLRNPHMGFSIMARTRPTIELPDAVPAWALDHAQIAYFRLPWITVVDEKGEYVFEKLDREFFSAWRAKGFRIALRVMPANKYAPTSSIFPRETLGKNIRFHRQVQRIDGKEKEIFLPVYWDPAYLAEHERLAKALGDYARNHPDLDLADMGGMGEYGEMHLHSWTPKDYEETGYTPEKYMGAVFQMMDHFDRHLPLVQKAICPPGDDIPEAMIRLVVDRARRSGWSLRHDGFMDDGAIPRIVRTFEESKESTRWIWEPSGGIWFKGGFGPGKKKYPVADYFRAMERFEPSTANLQDPGNFGGMTENDRPEIAKMARKIGYRLGVSAARLPATHERSADSVLPLPVSFTLRNAGLARCFESAVVRLRVRKGSTVLLDEPRYLTRTVSTIAPGSALTENLLLTLPAKIGPGDHEIDLGLRDQRTGGVLALDNAASAEGDWLSLGKVRIESAPRRAGSVDLAALLAETSLADTVERSRNEEGLKLEGKDASKGWSFARFGSEKIPANTFVRARMIVKAFRGEIPDSKLKFKLAVRAEDEKAPRNLNSTEYDFTREGEWQTLTVDYPCTRNETLEVALEKSRVAPTSVNAVIRSWTLEKLTVPWKLDPPED